MSTTQINLSTYYLRINEIKAVFGEGTAQAIKNEIDKKANLSHNHGNLQNNGQVGETVQANKNVVTDSNGKITTEKKPTIPTGSSTATDIKMDGTQAAGTSAKFARADHVHPTDTSRAAASHTHDDRYYTETEVDTKLNGKANSSHTHTTSQITDFPSTMTPSSHSHGNITNNGVITNQANKNVVTDSDGKITTEAKPTIPTANSTATNIKMDGTQSAGSLSTFAKADHVHPTDTSRAAASHTHDDRYYTETEINTKLNGKSDTSHNHDGTYLKSYTPPTASTSQAGIVQLNSATNSTSTTQAATPSAVKSAYDLATNKTVTLTKLSTATTGYIATYEIKQGSTSLGKIDIPKDYLVKSGSVKTVSTANSPVNGYAVGDKYIDFVINTKDSSGTDEHVYINVKDLIDIYEPVTQSTNGLMTAADKKKLDGIATGATKNTVSNSLTDTSTTNALSAAKGADLQTQINNIVTGETSTNHNHNTLYYQKTEIDTKLDEKSDTSHTHDDRYYTETEINTKLNGKANSSHTHGFVNNDGTIGGDSDKNKAVITNANGKIATGTIDTSRLSDSAVTSAKIADGTIVNGDISSSAAIATSKISGLDTALNSKAPTSHASTATTYGVGNASNYGHVKVSDNYTSSAGNASQSVAASSQAVKSVYDVANGKTVTLTKLSTATSGYIATYEIKQGTTSLGKIDIPKDYLVKSGSVKSVTTANSPVSGYAVGDKYIDFVINTKDSSGTDEHIYINVKDLIDKYTAGTGLTLSNGAFSVNYGTAAGTACQGNDSRLSDTRTPTFNHIGATSSATKDLNNYTTGGFYYCSHDTNESPYIANQPWTTGQKAFHLLVQTWGATESNYTKQTLTYYTTGQTYVRTKRSSSGWTSWIEMTKDTVYTHPASHPASMITGLSTAATSGSYKDLSNKPSYTATVNTSTSGYYEIGKINLDGTNNVSIYGKDTNTTYTAESTATNIKMNGTQSAGSLSTYAKGDHVHPTDTSRAPTSHAVNAATYGKSSASVFGHAKIIDSYTTTSGVAASDGIAASGKALNDAYTAAYNKANHSHNYLPNNANGTTTGTLTATKFINSSSNNTNILLGNGNTVAQSTFLKTSTLIPNGIESSHTDLNEYKTPGMYHTDSNANMSYIDNAPLANVAFTMIVYGGSNPTQIATTYHNTNPRTFVRTYNDWATPKWGSWFELSKTNHNHDSTYLKTGTGTVTSTNIADGTIVNGDIASNASIDFSKLNISKANIIGLGIPSQDTNTTYSADGSTLTKSSDNVFSLKDSTNYVKKSSTSGLLKNDGTIMTSGTGASNFALGNHTHSNYLTSHQDISGKVDKSQGTSNSGKFLKVNSSGNVACESVTIPTKTSQLTNDSNYLTSHQDISGKLDKSQGQSNSGKFLKVNSSGNVACESVTIPTIGTGASNAAAGNHTHTNWQKVNSASDTNKSLEIYINPDVKMGMAFIKMKSFVISDTNVHPGGFFTYTIELQAAYRPRTITYSPATSSGRVFVWMSAEGQVGYRATAAGTYDIEACITWGYF